MQFDRIAFHAGRVLLASLFILGGFNKLASYAETLVRMDLVGLSPAFILLPATILLEIGAGLIVIAGRRYAVVAALALATFTLATNVFFHRFWAIEEPLRSLEISLFFKNVAIAGGLLLTAGVLTQRSNDGN
ncbi:MAG: DoxX family protein [Pseudomonadota bacterium]